MLQQLCLLKVLRPTLMNTHSKTDEIPQEEKFRKKIQRLKNQHQCKALLEMRERNSSEIEQLKASNTLKSFEVMEKHKPRL